eukprot:6489559-Amphidinium_carterae.1
MLMTAHKMMMMMMMMTMMMLMMMINGKDRTRPIRAGLNNENDRRLDHLLAITVARSAPGCRILCVVLLVLWLESRDKLVCERATSSAMPATTSLEAHGV